MKAYLIHVPKGFCSADWSHNYINVMPMGLFCIANHANQNGHSVQVMNAAVHGSMDQALDVIRRRLRDHGAEVVGIPIHWHLATFDACAAAKKIKEDFPRCRIIVGGLTASVYPREILEACDAIDAVVIGDGEVPFTTYLHQIERGTERLDQVPNLCWRSSSGIVANGLRYVATEAQLSSLDFDPSKAIVDLSEYANGLSMFDAMTGKEHDMLAERLSDKLFFLNLGRGCSLNCIYCAGSSSSFSKYFGRDKVCVRTVDAVLRTVRDAVGCGFRKFHICFDPPWPRKDEFFRELFARIRSEVSRELTLVFEAYALPSSEFLQGCSACFREAIVILSPCFFRADGMKRYKGYRFSRQQLKVKLHEISSHPNLKAFVYYAVTPMDDWGDSALLQHVIEMKQLRNQHGCQVSAMPILAEPGSPWVSSPELFGQHAALLTFQDYWQQWQAPLTRWPPELCRMQDVNEVLAQINSLMANDSIP
jgi:hypothetical protein